MFKHLDGSWSCCNLQGDTLRTIREEERGRQGGGNRERERGDWGSRERQEKGLVERLKDRNRDITLEE